MADKPRNPRRPGEAPFQPTGRNKMAGGPGERPATPGRFAGKPATGPARTPRNVGGVDRFALERLAEQGLLSKEGRTLLGNEGGPARAGKGPRFPGATKLGAARARGEAVREERDEDWEDRPARPARTPLEGRT
ncbi:MAG TPA: hypothetical protein VK464_13295, partial [Symbiobacteriaceae bacterium]|nr:hypothetical protein [Symbiobacteriaceae bacterium]